MAAQKAARRGSPGASRRVLVVDDNEDAAAMLADALSGKRAPDARIAHDAPAALRLAAEFCPHVAFLDIGLPVMDGYELATQLREVPELRGIRLIAVTGYGQESDRQKSKAAGFHPHLVKPVDLEALDAALGVTTP